jgi:hypothetical protein
MSVNADSRGFNKWVLVHSHATMVRTPLHTDAVVSKPGGVLIVAKCIYEHMADSARRAGFLGSAYKNSE